MSVYTQLLNNMMSELQNYLRRPLIYSFTLKLILKLSYTGLKNVDVITNSLTIMMHYVSIISVCGQHIVIGLMHMMRHQK